MNPNVPMQEAEINWSCPWCEELATLSGNPPGICESKVVPV